MKYDVDDTYSWSNSSTSASSLEELLDNKKFEKEGIKPFSFEPCYISEELKQIACNSQQRNNVYAEEHNMQWCICQHCVKDVQIVEKVCTRTLRFYWKKKKKWVWLHCTIRSICKCLLEWRYAGSSNWGLVGPQSYRYWLVKHKLQIYCIQTVCIVELWVPWQEKT